MVIKLVVVVVVVDLCLVQMVTDEEMYLSVIIRLSMIIRAYSGKNPSASRGVNSRMRHSGHKFGCSSSVRQNVYGAHAIVSVNAKQKMRHVSYKVRFIFRRPKLKHLWQKVFQLSRKVQRNLEAIANS